MAWFAAEEASLVEVGGQDTDSSRFSGQPWFRMAFSGQQRGRNRIPNAALTPRNGRKWLADAEKAGIWAIVR